MITNTTDQDNLVVDDYVVSAFKESVEADIFWRFEDEPTAEPKLLGSAAAGKSLAVPFDLTQGRPIRLFAVSRTADNNLSTQDPRAGVQTVFDPNLETLTPAIGQLTAATNTQVTIWVNNFTTKTRFRKVEVSPNSDMSSPDLVEEFSAADFPQSLMPATQLVTKTGVSGTVTKYIRVSHSSNGTNWGTASNILTVTFADSGGSGGTGGDGGPCFAGDTPLMVSETSSIELRDVWNRRSQFIGVQITSFNDAGDIVDAIIEDVFRHTVYKALEVVFEDGSEMTVTAEHPFLTEDFEFQPIGKFAAGDSVMASLGDWMPLTIKSITPVDYPDGLHVYNLRTSTGHYFADRKGVHNLKDIEL